MEINSYQPSVEVRLSPNTAYEYELVNQDTKASTSGTITTTSSGIAKIPFEDALQTTKYDSWYELSIYYQSKAPENLVYIDTVAKIRPYVNAPELSTYLNVSLDKAVEYESIARALINSVIGYAFEFKRLSLELVGNGSDTLHTHERIVKIHSVTENNVEIWVTGNPLPYVPAEDYFGIRILEPNENNRLEFVPVWATRNYSPVFKEHYDYVFDVDAGWPVVPEDIKKATKLLANDISCGTNRYANKYIQAVSTGSAQRIQYFHSAIYGTGNLLVDNLISPYTLYSVRTRVL